MEDGTSLNGATTSFHKVTGILEKKSEKLKLWNYRFFDFDNGVLQWSKVKPKDQDQSKPLGALRVMRIAEVPQRKKHRSYRSV